MSYTVQDAINEVRVTYPDLSTARGLKLARDLEEQILMHVPLRRATLEAPPLVKGTQEYALASSVVKIWAVRYYSSAQNTNGVLTDFEILSPTHIDELDTFTPQWRAVSGDPSKFYATQSGTSGLIGLYANPDKSTVQLSGATNASPIVATSTAAHGFTTGDTVSISGVAGNTAANGIWTITVLSSTTFSLTGSAGNGAYTSGGAVLGPGSPKVYYECTSEVTLDLTTPISDTPVIKSLYEDGLRYLHAKSTKKPEMATYKKLFEDVLAEQSEATMQRSGRVQPSIPIVDQRPGWRTGGFRRS